mgnify:CR=1 FL=1
MLCNVWYILYKAVWLFSLEVQDWVVCSPGA